MNHIGIVISTGAWWFYRHAKWRDLQVARAGYSAGTNKLQVSPLRRQKSAAYGRDDTVWVGSKRATSHDVWKCS